MSNPIVGIVLGWVIGWYVVGPLCHPWMERIDRKYGLIHYTSQPDSGEEER